MCQWLKEVKMLTKTRHCVCVERERERESEIEVICQTHKQKKSSWASNEDRTITTIIDV